MSNQDMYSKYKDLTNEYFEDDDFHKEFINAIKAGSNNYSLYQRYLDYVVDVKWVEEIEGAIIPLDNIIRNPRRFIQNLEEIVPIEQARRITNDSIRHLAQHTSMIAKVDKKGFVTPNKILNVFKEETFATYENRFIYTLLYNVQYFIDKRLRILNEAKTESRFKLQVENEFTYGDEQIKYEMSFISNEIVKKGEVEYTVDDDTSNMSLNQRIERIKKILGDFQGSPLIKSLNGVALVKPPIVKTNVILKDPNFKRAMRLWTFIERYNEAGLEAKVVEKEQLPNEEYMNDLFKNMILNYYVFNHYNKPNKSLRSFKSKEIIFSPKLMYTIMEQYIEEFSLDIDKVEKVFVDQIKKATQEHKENEEKVKSAITRAIKEEKNRVLKLKRNEAEKLAKEKEKVKKQKELEQKLLKEKLEKEAALKQKLLEEKLERERIAKEKAEARKQKLLQEKLERERLAKEKEEARLQKILEAKQLAKEKEKAKKQKERELLKAKEQKLKEALKEKHQKEVELAKEKMKKEKEIQKAKEMKVKEALREKHQKEVALAKEKAKKEKEIQRAKELKQKEAALAKEKAKKQKKLQKTK